MVAARETKLLELLGGSKQYQVPLYQRTYSWSDDHLKRLWSDVIALAEDRLDDAKATHFVGSLVLAPSPNNGPTGVSEFLVVDGQQRLTTLSLLLCALRDHRAATEGAHHRDRINELYLINKWESDPHRLKLLPTQADRAAYRACVDSTPQAGGADPLGNAYRYFLSQLVAWDSTEDLTDLERLEDAVISGLAVVSVTAQAGDNAYRIFESLNNTGLKLSQGDLLRNYLFMRLPTRGEQVYSSLWLPLQSQLSTEQLETLFWLDLVQIDARVKQSETYSRQVARLDKFATEEQVEQEVLRFSRLGTLFHVILDPGREQDHGVRQRLERLSEWGTTTVYPVLLHLLDRRANGTATSEEVARAMLYLESFFVRRLLLGAPSNNLNRILLALVTEMSKDIPVDQAVHRYLSTGRKYFATDRELSSAMERSPLYLIGRAQQRTLVLRWLEESLGSKEPVNMASLTIEHVMPQTPTAAWKQELATDLESGEDFDTVHEALVHTIGNLTLTGYNASLGNAPFEKKRAQFLTSGLVMNQEIAQRPRWSRPQILERARNLAQQVAARWPGPGRGDEQTEVDGAWLLMNQALSALPAGTWTSYGDLAALIGSHPVAVGARLATVPSPNPHRVLQDEGTVSPNFRWLEGGRTDDPTALLTAEGVNFDDKGRANPAQRLRVDELAELCGLPGSPGALPDLEAGRDPLARDRFLGQLGDRQSAETVHGVMAVLGAWAAKGGWLDFGRGSETSCFLMARSRDHALGTIWPLVLYPSGKAEVVFQYLANREPFVDVVLREQFRQRLNNIAGVDLPAAKLSLRPGFDLNVLADGGRRALLAKHLEWFIDQTRDDDEGLSEVA